MVAHSQFQKGRGAGYGEIGRKMEKQVLPREQGSYYIDERAALSRLYIDLDINWKELPYWIDLASL